MAIFRRISASLLKNPQSLIKGIQRLQLKFNMSPAIWNLGKNVLVSRQIFKSYIEKQKLWSLTQIENKIQANKEMADKGEPSILAQPTTKIYKRHYEGCEKTFQRQWNLDLHKATKHAEHLKIVKCPDCHETFRNYKELGIHIGKFHRVTDHQCPRCKKYLSTKGNLKTHIDRCLGIKNFKCPKCKTAFSQKIELQNHMKYKHSDDRNYICDVEGCGKAFKSKSNLAQHKQTHSEERPHQCPYCEKAYKQFNDLLTHVDTKHSKEDDED